MRTGKIVAAIVSGILLFTAPVFAASIDLDSMTVEELVSLKDEINEKNAEKDGSNIISYGNYVVGKDFRAGHWKFSPTENSEPGLYDNERTMCIYFYESEEARENNEYEFARLTYNVEEMRPEESYEITLEDGNVFAVRDGEAIVEEIKNVSWAP